MSQFSNTIPRLITSQLNEAMALSPVVCLVGARQTGKTTLVRLYDAKRTYINLDDPTYLQVANNDPAGFVESLPELVILDEIQRAPELLPAIKMVVDEGRHQHKNQAGRFLLTGSANILLLPKVSESLAGRMQVLPLNPLSEWEKQLPIKRKGEAALSNCLFSQFISNTLKKKVLSKRVDQQQLAIAVCSGGYPAPIGLQAKKAERWYRQYLNAIVQKDIKDIANIRDEDELIRLMEILSLRTGTLLNQSSLAGELGIDRGTLEKYLKVLEKLFLIRRLPAWHSNQTKRLVKTPKIHVIDSGMAAILARLNPTDWSAYATDFGGLLESFVVQQLMCQSTWFDEEYRFYHYRDKDKVEVDLVIVSGRKVWGVEIKRSGKVMSSDGKGLSRLAEKAGEQFQGGMVLYSGNALYKLDKLPNCLAVPLSYLWQQD